MYSKLQDGSFIVCGFVARDAEVKHTKNDKMYVTWSVKVGEKPKAEGEERGEAIWTNCKAWNDVAKIASRIVKGDTVLAIGKIETFQNDEGKVYKTLNAEFIQIMQKSNAQQVIQQAENAGITTAPADNIGDEFETIDDGECPF